MGSMAAEAQLFEVDPVVPAAPRERADVPVDKVFRAYDQDQSFLMPPSLRDWLPVIPPMCITSGIFSADTRKWTENFGTSAPV